MVYLLLWAASHTSVLILPWVRFFWRIFILFLFLLLLFLLCLNMHIQWGPRTRPWLYSVSLYELCNSQKILWTQFSSVLMSTDGFTVSLLGSQVENLPFCLLGNLVIGDLPIMALMAGKDKLWSVDYSTNLWFKQWRIGPFVFHVGSRLSNQLLLHLCFVVFFL